MKAISLNFDWPSEESTQAHAQALAAALLSVGAARLPPCCITLEGDLGAGKTTWTRHLLRALGVQGAVKSPTYAVLETYETAAGPIAHFDFYRFDDPQEWEDAGFRDVYAGPGLKLAEWAERVAGMLAVSDLCLHIEQPLNAEGSDVRRGWLRADTDMGRRVLKALATPRP